MIIKIKKGDKILFDGKVYEPLIDGNSRSPKDYIQEWEVVV